jgi:hypothetical protein
MGLRFRLIAEVLVLVLIGSGTDIDIGLPLFRRRGLAETRVTGRPTQLRLFLVVANMPEYRFGLFILDLEVDTSRLTIQIGSSLRRRIRIRPHRRWVVIRALGFARFRGVGFPVSCQGLE